MLIVFGGLPGTGKTTLAKALATHLQAVYLRIDTIEQALRESTMLKAEVGPAGYMVAYDIATDNLNLGHIVIADSVNPLSVTRAAWRSVADCASVRVAEVEVICSDRTEHCRRIETRQSDIAGLTLPTWQEVLARDYEPWDHPRIVIDTATKTVAQCLATLIEQLDCTAISGA